jgi:hypothetical protein
MRARERDDAVRWRDARRVRASAIVMPARPLHMTEVKTPRDPRRVARAARNALHLLRRHRVEGPMPWGSSDWDRPKPCIAHPL